MPKLTVQGFGEFEVAQGKRLVKALVEDAGTDQLHACGGNSRCTTCRVRFLDGEPDRITQAENETLTARGVTEAGLAHLRSLPRLRRLDLTGCQAVGREGLRALAELPALEHLVLSRTDVRDLRPLEGAHALKSLAVNHSGKFAGAGLAGLKSLERLELSCIRGSMGNAGLAEIGELRRLRELDLSHCDKVTDEGLLHLAGLTELRRLSLYGLHKVTTPGFNAVLPHLEQLEELDLGFCWWHEGHGMRFPPRLRRLDLRESKRIVDEVIVGLPKGELVALNLHYCHELTDLSLEALRGLERLEELDLGSIRSLTDSGLEAVATLRGLRVLDASDNDHFTDAGLAQLGALESLESLSLWHTEGLTGERAGWLASLTRLRTLNLADCAGFDDAGLAHLEGLGQLTELYLDHTGVTGAGLAALAGLPLRELTLTGCGAVTDDDLAALASLSSLRYLSLLECPALTDAAVAALQDALPDCRIAR